MDIKRIFKLVKGCYPNIKPFIKQNIAFIILTELVVVLGLIMPLIIRYLIDEVLTAGNWDLFPNFIFLMAAAIIFSRLFSITTNIVYNAFSANIVTKAKDSLFEKLINKNLSFFNYSEDGELVDILMHSPDQLHTVPSIYLERLLSSAITIIIVLIILFAIEPLMALASLIASPIFVFIYLKFRKKFFSQLQTVRKENAKLLDFYINTFHNIKQVKNLVSEEKELSDSQKRTSNIRSLLINCAYTGALMNSSVQIATQLNQFGIIVYGAILINKDQMTIGTLVAFYTYLEMLYQPMIDIIQTLTDVNSSLVGMERYLKFYNELYQEDFINGDNFDSQKNDIEFKGVSFAYSGHQVLSDSSFAINSGEKVLLSGRSGIGKSTFASLLKRFYDCEIGEILIGGTNVKDYKLSQLRNNVFYITQDNYFYPMTIRENFRRLNSSITDEQIIEALQKAQIYDDLFTANKNGLDTSLDKNAALFSGGQKRRLAIALLFISEAPIIVLDEVFVGLDKKVINNIWQQVKAYTKNKTLIVIDHNFDDSEYFNKRLIFANQKISQARK